MNTDNFLAFYHVDVDTQNCLEALPWDSLVLRTEVYIYKIDDTFVRFLVVASQ